MVTFGTIYSVWSKNSCGFARVVFQEPPEPFTTLHRALALCVLADRRKEQNIALALMIPLVMKMRDILPQRMAERRFPKQDQPREALLFDRSDPPLRVGVGLHRQLYRIGTIRYKCSPSPIHSIHFRVSSLSSCKCVSIGVRSVSTNQWC